VKDASTSSDAVEESGPTLHRGLQNRHIQLIALGGAIGTGLFLGIGPAIQMAGPAVLLGYAVAGIVAFLIMRQLGEMVVEEPVSGSFAHFAYKYWGPFAGFLSGWNYWVMFVLVGMAELTAAGIYMQYWLPDVPTWIWAAAFFIIINAVNLVNVRLYGEAEFWFALIKVLAIIGMIGFGLWMLFGGHGGSKAGIDNLWKHGGFFATGWHGLIMSLAVIMFSFGGLELIGITAAEAQNPEKSIPKAVNQVVYRILLFLYRFAGGSAGALSVGGNQIRQQPVRDDLS
jgi:phenylalanine-specific permease